MFRRSTCKAPDLLGQAILDYWNDDSKGLIRVHSHLGDTQNMDPAIFFREFEEMPELEKVALRQVKGRVLDIGAGAGAHSLALANINLDGEVNDPHVLEISGAACRVMRERGLKTVIEQDFMDYHAPEQYDTLLFLMNGSGLAGSLEGLGPMLAHAKSMLSLGGRILMDSTDVLYMYTDDNGSVSLNLNAAYYGEIEMWMKYGKMRSEAFSWLYIDPSNLRSHAEELDMNFELLFTGERGHYLASLSA